MAALSSIAILGIAPIYTDLDTGDRYYYVSIPTKAVYKADNPIGSGFTGSLIHEFTGIEKLQLAVAKDQSFFVNLDSDGNITKIPISWFKRSPFGIKNWVPTTIAAILAAVGGIFYAKKK